MKPTAIIALAVISGFLISSGLILKKSSAAGRDYNDLIQKYSRLNGIDPGLTEAVIHAESGFRSSAVSSAGALGLMQIMPATGRDLASTLGIKEFANSDLFNPETNIRLGTYYLGMLRDMFNGDPRLFLAAYNAGPAQVRRWMEENPDIRSSDLIDMAAFPQTRAYVRKVMKKWGR